MSFLIGIDCPKGSRQVQGGQIMAGDPFGEDALLYTKELCLHREVRCVLVLLSWMKDDN